MPSRAGAASATKVQPSADPCQCLHAEERAESVHECAAWAPRQHQATGARAACAACALQCCMPPSRPSRDPPGGHAAAEAGVRDPAVPYAGTPQQARVRWRPRLAGRWGVWGGEADARRVGGAGLSEGEAAEKPFIASMGIYVFRKDVLIKLLKSSFPKAPALP